MKKRKENNEGSRLKIIPLGGLEQIGMNITAFEYNDDIVKTKSQDYKIGNNYRWMHTNFIYCICSNIIYLIARIFSFLYGKIYLRVRVENKVDLKKFKNTGYFVYGNHTQVFGDVFLPARVISKRFYTICSQILIIFKKELL